VPFDLPDQFFPCHILRKSVFYTACVIAENRFPCHMVGYFVCSFGMLVRTSNILSECKMRSELCFFSHTQRRA